MCTLRICSARLIIERTIATSARIELVYCSDLINEGSFNRQINITSKFNVSCASIGVDTCTRLLNLHQTCQTTTQMQGDPDPTDDSTTQCPSCPPTIADYPITTPDPPTTIIDCLTSPSNVPTSSKPTLNTEPEVSSQTSIIDERDSLKVIVTTLGNTESEGSAQISKVIDERESLKVIVTILGVLVGILVMLLAVVTSGWVWTCWTMKRNKTTTPEHVRYTNDNCRPLG